MKVKDFPKQVVDKIYESHGYRPPQNDSERDPDIEEIVVEQLPSDEITFLNWVIVPGHNFDLREANISPICITNLRQVDHTHLRNAATATIYQKVDPNLPALLIFSWDDGKTWYYQV